MEIGRKEEIGVGREGDCAGNLVVISRFRLFRAQAGFGGQSRVYEIRQAKKKGQSFESYHRHWPH